MILSHFWKIKANQIIIILTFFVGMMSNYFILYPILEKENEKRFNSEINCFVNYIHQSLKHCPIDYQHIDSLANHAADLDPYKGYFSIIGSDKTIIYSRDAGSVGGCYSTVIDSVFSPVALKLIDDEYNCDNWDSSLAYDKDNWCLYFAKNDLKLGVLYFYSTEYVDIGDQYLYFFILLIIMLLCGLVIIFLCIKTNFKLGMNEINEMVTKHQLEAAAELQKSMLPQMCKNLMRINIDARLYPAQMVGGDLYYYLLRDGKLYFCIGDVSGKGIPSALYMSRAITLFRSLALEQKTSSEIASRINSELCLNNDQSIFTTAFIGVLDVNSNKLNFCNCGHDEPLYWNGRDTSMPEYLNTSFNLPLGFDSEIIYTEGEMQLEQNCMLFFYTDGINEAKNPENEMFGLKRLKDVVSGTRILLPHEINDDIVREVSSFRSSADQSDDITLLTIKLVPGKKEVTIANSLPELVKLRRFSNEMLNECPIDNKQRTLIRAGLDEAVTNCVLYAYDDSSRDINISSEIIDNKLYLTVVDSGKAFNPLDYKCDAEKKDDDVSVGGMGIPMIKSIFDSVEYKREDGRNILILIKKFDNETQI